MTNRTSTLVLASLFAVLVGYNNCSKVDFATPDKAAASSTETGDNLPVDEDVIANCKGAVGLQTLNQEIVFDDTKVESGRSTVCEFSTGDNLGHEDGVLRARYEQYRDLNLPANAVICDIKMQTDVQSFRYDDVFYLTFNNYILASNLNLSVQKVTPEPVKMRDSGSLVGLYEYDWLKFRDTDFSGVASGSDDYCLGKAEGYATCRWPVTQQQGTIDFDFDPELLVNIGLKANAQSQQRFGFIITGDNDPSLDCYHERLAVKMQISYYVR